MMKRFALFAIPAVAACALLFVSASPAQAQFSRYGSGFYLDTGGVQIQIGGGYVPRYNYYPHYPSYPRYTPYVNPRYNPYVNPRYNPYVNPRYNPYPSNPYPYPVPGGRPHWDPHHGWHYDR